MQVSIQDDDGRELEPFETGEICVIGPAVFAGYYDNPEANAKAFRDGWFRTGDLGHMDEEGFVYITGRASDMYISGGSNIYPREIEEKILTHPAIGEVAVLGVPDPVWGEVGVAVCVAREGAGAVTEAELAAFLAPKVPRYKMPKRFFFWDALPKSGYGKMPKRLVRDELEARGLLDARRASRRSLSRCEASSNPARPWPERIQWVEARGRAFSFTLEAGVPLLEAARRGFAAQGFAGGVLEHPGRGARPVRLCDAGAVEDRRQRRLLQRHLPARRRHAAQDGRDDARAARRRAVLPLPRAVDRGRRPRRRRPYPAGGDHGRRAVRGGGVRHRRRGLRGGARPRDQLQTVRAGAMLRLQARRQRAAPSRCGCGRTRILPARWKRSAASAASRSAKLHGGVGSTIGARFADGRIVEPFATELVIRSGVIAAGAGGALEAELDIALVDYTGGLAEGRLERGDNPVLMTMELVLEVLDGF